MPLRWNAAMQHAALYIICLFCFLSVPVDALQGLLSQADEDQVRMMEERVILVDWNDKAIGSGSKKETHIMASINEGLLHRAFSVFLFTPDGKLILQQVSVLAEGLFWSRCNGL